MNFDSKRCPFCKTQWYSHKLHNDWHFTTFEVKDSCNSTPKSYTHGHNIPHSWFSEKHFNSFDSLPIGIKKQMISHLKALVKFFETSAKITSANWFGMLGISPWALVPSTTQKLPRNWFWSTETLCGMMNGPTVVHTIQWPIASFHMLTRLNNGFRPQAGEWKSSSLGAQP